jgi:hypothetical protein
MTENWLPWLTYPGLTLDRLTAVGDLIRTARTEAVDDHNPVKGETNWSLGCRQYERTTFTLTWAQQELPWLRVASGDKGGPVHFVMCIGIHPVRFYRGDPDDVPQRYRQPSIPELIEQQQALALDDAIPANRSLRIAIQNDPEGRPLIISLIDIDDTTGETINRFTIPSAATAAEVVEFVPPAPAVILPPVTAQLIDELPDSKTKAVDE